MLIITKMYQWINVGQVEWHDPSEISLICWFGAQLLSIYDQYYQFLSI